jgi:hypothetical protein
MSSYAKHNITFSYLNSIVPHTQVIATKDETEGFHVDTPIKMYLFFQIQDLNYV